MKLLELHNTPREALQEMEDEGLESVKRFYMKTLEKVNSWQDLASFSFGIASQSFGMMEKKGFQSSKVVTDKDILKPSTN